VTAEGWLATNLGVLSIEISSATRAVRLTASDGEALSAVGLDDSLALIAAVELAGRRVWAANAAAQDRDHRQFLEELGNPRIHSGSVVLQTLQPAKNKTDPPAGKALAAQLENCRGSAPAARQHATEIEAEDQMWRKRTRTGYRVDTAGLSEARQGLHRSIALFAREHGVDIRKSDEKKSEWLTNLGVRFTRSAEYGWSQPGACDISQMSEANTEAWLAYRTAHRMLKRAQILDGLHRRVTNGRVHPHILTNFAASGRMSMRNPALQSLATEHRYLILGEPLNDVIGVDHSAQELRVLARLVGDRSLISRIITEDIYSELAAVTGQTRADEKWRVLAWLYGQHVDSLAKKVGEEQARATHSGIHQLLPEVVEWRAEQTARATRNEKLTTLTGRPLPDLGPKRGQMGLAANYLVQGSARDAYGACVRRAMAAGLECWIPLHDELFVLSPAGQSRKTSDDLVEAMTINLGLGVVLTGVPKVFIGRWGK
jgi:hypothetical protein